MNRIFVLFFLIFYGGNILHVFSQELKPIVYLIPGQGADYRLYNNLKLDSCFETKHIEYFTPVKGWSMRDFAVELAKQIDTTRQFYIVGVSFGGMLAIEMNQFLNPNTVIVISSAKSRKEFPFGYRFQKAIPLYKVVPKRLYKIGSKIVQPIFEPDRRHCKETFKAMLHDKDPAFLKNVTALIMEWERESIDPDIIHIHGERDNTLPARNIKYHFLLEGGSHLIVLTRGEEVSDLVNNILISTL